MCEEAVIEVNLGSSTLSLAASLWKAAFRRTENFLLPLEAVFKVFISTLLRGFSLYSFVLLGLYL